MGNSNKLLRFLLVKAYKFTCISVVAAAHTKIACKEDCI